MEWIHHFQLYLFDFDGLLVNTEELHFHAYKNMCHKRGYDLDWDFATYSSYALYGATNLKEALYKKYPTLMHLDWNTLYGEKKKEYLQLLQDETDLLMPGAKSLLTTLHNANIKRCVVTNSFKEQIDLIVSKNPILQTIPFWITREDYKTPKPDPECYLKAISLYCKEGEKVIGFEDSPRGFKALNATKATSVLISPTIDVKELLGAKPPFFHFSSLKDVNI